MEASGRARRSVRPQPSPWGSRRGCSGVGSTAGDSMLVPRDQPRTRTWPGGSCSRADSAAISSTAGLPCRSNRVRDSGPLLESSPRPGAGCHSAGMGIASSSSPLRRSKRSNWGGRSGMRRPSLTTQARSPFNTRPSPSMLSGRVAPTPLRRLTTPSGRSGDLPSLPSPLQPTNWPKGASLSSQSSSRSAR